MSNTPRTDAFKKEVAGKIVTGAKIKELLDLAETIERELTQAQADLARKDEALNLAADELYFTHRDSMGRLSCSCCNAHIGIGEEHYEKCFIHNIIAALSPTAGAEFVSIDTVVRVLFDAFRNRKFTSPSDLKTLLQEELGKGDK